MKKCAPICEEYRLDSLNTLIWYLKLSAGHYFDCYNKIWGYGWLIESLRIVSVSRVAKAIRIFLNSPASCLHLSPALRHSPFLLSLLKPVHILGFPGPVPFPIHYSTLSRQAIWSVLWIVHYAHMKAITAPVLVNSSNIYLLPSEQDVVMTVTPRLWASV